MPNNTHQQHQDDVPLHCHQLVDDFTLVTTPTPTAKDKVNKDNASSSPESNKENWISGNSAKNYRTVPQTIAAERLQLLRAIELEHSIFTLSFLLIETFFRPSPTLSSSSNHNNSGESFTIMAGKRKRRGRQGSSSTELLENASAIHHSFTPPRRRIYGLSKAYKNEYASQMSLPGVSKHFATFYHDLLNWQLVFAGLITPDQPAQVASYSNVIIRANNNSESSAKSDHHLATELNYDALFDYEDALAATANLLSIARQHSDLLDGLVLRSGEDASDHYATTYVRESSPNNYGGEFVKLVALVEGLIKAKKERLQEVKERMLTAAAADATTEDNGGNILSGWFRGGSGSGSGSPTSSSGHTNKAEVQLKNLQRELNAWEELLDVLEISAK